ncbi:MAG: hypothetical protein L3J12_02380, partial [Spirochaetales bacterium]|nr:hypothetical protein [Spirochaetales bacterium]
MRKKQLLSVFIVVLLIFTSCVSQPGRKESASKKMEELKVKYQTLNLKENEVYIEEVVPSEEENYEFKEFSIASGVLSFLSELDLHQSVNIEEQYKLAQG